MFLPSGICCEMQKGDPVEFWSVLPGLTQTIKMSSRKLDHKHFNGVVSWDSWEVCGHASPPHASPESP